VPDDIIETERLLLTPLRVSDAEAMTAVLSDREVYRFMGGDPPTVEQLEARYRAQIAGSPRPSEVWHNWIVRLAASDAAAGYVQATVTGDHADVAWVIGIRWQGQHIAREAAMAMCRWLSNSGIRLITAHIHPDHAASCAVAAACGLGPTDVLDDDGEVVWESLDQS
jgi:RimJ/RimL family protein N-acetyltransferase